MTGFAHIYLQKNAILRMEAAADDSNNSNSQDDHPT